MTYDWCLNKKKLKMLLLTSIWVFARKGMSKQMMSSIKSKLTVSNIVKNLIEVNKNRREELKKIDVFSKDHWKQNTATTTTTTTTSDDNSSKCSRLNVILRQEPLVGVVSIPKLGRDFLSGGPKGSVSGEMLITEDRWNVVLDLLITAQEKSDGASRFGKLISGPNGTGKSAISLLLALVCQSCDVPSLYIPSAHDWTGSVNETVHSAGQWFMHQFFLQNADLIVDNDRLIPYFLDQLNGNKGIADVKTDAYQRFCDALMRNAAPPCVFIVDEAQVLYEHATRHRDSPFRNDFVIWTGRSRCFSSLLIASGNGLADFRLPSSGENHRLCYIEPLSRVDTLLLLTSPQSPLFVSSEFAQLASEAFKSTGGVIGSLFELAKTLNAQDDRATLHRKLRVYKQTKSLEFGDILKVWLKREVQPDDRSLALEALLQMVCGTRTLDRISKTLYDAGLVQRDAVATHLVHPVCDLAKQAMVTAYNSNFVSLSKPLSLYDTPAERGYAFQQMITVGLALPVSTGLVKAHSYNGKQEQQRLSLHAHENKYFTDLSEIEFDPERSVQWISTDFLHYVCGGILIKARRTENDELVVDSRGRPVCEVQLLDYCSVSHHPLAPHRREKVTKLRRFFKETLKPLMERNNVGCSDVQIVVFYDGDFATKTDDCSDENRRQLEDDVWVVDQSGALQLRVKM